MKASLYEIDESLPFLPFMHSNDANQLSRKQLAFLLKPSSSEEGTNARKYENDVYAAFTKYCMKVQVLDGVQSPLAAFYSLQLGWMKNHLLGSNYNFAFSLLLPLKIING